MEAIFLNFFESKDFLKIFLNFIYSIDMTFNCNILLRNVQTNPILQ